MEGRPELAATAPALERVATGGLAAMMPGRAVGSITAPGDDTEAARYVARLLGICQVVLGAMLWQAHNDRAWPRRVATLNALAEALDAAATLVSVAQGRGEVAPPRPPPARRRPEPGRRRGDEPR